MDSVPIELKSVVFRSAENIGPKAIEVKSNSEAKSKSVESLSDAAARVREDQLESRVDSARVQAKEVELNKALRRFGPTELKVELRDGGEGPVFHIVDKKTGKELLQIPSEYKLSIERTVEMLKGALFDSEV